MEKIGLVTVLYKSEKVLAGFIKSLIQQDFQDYVLYLVDNNPNSECDALLQKIFQEAPFKMAYKHLKSSSNVGVAEGNNIGIRAALKDACDYILLSNNDIEIEQRHLFKELLTIAQTQNEKIIVPKILYYDTRKIWLDGGHYNRLRALGIHDKIGESNDKSSTVIRYISYAPTCFMLIHCDVFKSIGNMDSKYFAYIDDTDFVYRALQKGFKILYTPSLYILHKVSSSTGGDNSLFYIYYSNRNKIYFIKKHYKGLLKFASLFYFLMARTFYYFKFNKEQKAILLQGIRDGFKLPISTETEAYN